MRPKIKLNQILKHLKEYERISEVIGIKPITEGNRLIDIIAVINESTEELNELTETQKYEVDNLIWEAIFYYVTNTEDVFEGFWNTVVKKAKDLGNKGLSYAKKIVNNIGGLIKDIGAYINKFYDKVKNLASQAAMKSFGTIKGKIESHKAVAIKEGMKEDVSNLKATMAHFRNKAVGAQVQKNVGGAQSLAVKAAKEDQEGHDRLEKVVTSEEGDASQNNQNESIECASIANAINEMRAQGDFDFKELLESAEQYKELSEILEAEDAGKELEIETKTRKQKILDALKKAASIGNIIGFITSGIVKLFENMIEKMMQKSFKALSQLCKKSGGPGVFDFIAISALTAIVMGLIIEFGLETISSLTNVESLKGISKALHSTSPLYLLGHAAAHAIPGAATFAKAITIGLVAYMGIEHLYHKSEKEGAH